MNTVVQLRPRRKTAPDNKAVLDLIDAALGAEFVRLARLYGACAVTTVALRYVTECMEHARRKRRPVEDEWLKDLKQRFDRAMEGKT